jgi:hypothetical protein
VVNQRVLEQVEKWRKELINLFRGNRLLYFRHTRTSTLEIEEPDLAEVLAELGPLGKRGWDFYMPPEVEEGEEERQLPPRKPTELLTTKTDTKGIVTALRSLDRRARQEFMDKGLWVLYLGVGMLEWVDPSEDELAHSPIVLVPVTLERASPREPFRLHRTEEDSLVNPALVVKLESEFGIQLPTLDDLEDVGPAAVLEIVDRAVATRGWRIQRRLVLGAFSFHKEVMYRDLLENEETICADQIVQALVLGQQAEIDFDFDPVPEEDLDEKAPIEQAETILDADASQRQCIAAACADHTFVMDGPPGTGKSQTITNIIAELLEQGRKVLFVSEKAAALEVVYARLKDAGLGPYVLELHSHKATRREVAEELGLALARQPRIPPTLESGDVSRLISRRKQLSNYALAMNEIRQPLGRSLYQVVGRISQLQNLPQAPAPTTLGADLTSETLMALLDSAVSLARAWGPVERGEDFQWRELRDPEACVARKNEIATQLEAALQAIDELQGVTTSTAEAMRLPWKRGPEDSHQVVELLEHLLERHHVPISWLTLDALDGVSRRIEELSAAFLNHTDFASRLNEEAGARWRDLDPEDFMTLGEAIGQVAQVDPSWRVPVSFDSKVVGALQGLLAQSVTQLPESLSLASDLAGKLGMSAKHLSLDRALEVAELGSFLGVPTAPESTWLNPTVISAVRAGASVLENLVLDYRRRRDDLSTVFTEDVLNLDLQSILVRFDSVHKGLGKLRKAYRADKQALSRCTHSGKVKKAVLSRLPDVLEWQRVSRNLLEAEQEHAAILGTHYYRSTQTDFNSLTSAIAVAQRALEIVAHELDREALSVTVARGAEPDPAILLHARQVQKSLSEWKERANEILGDQAEGLASGSLERSIDWCASVVEPMARIRLVLDRVSEVTGRPAHIESAQEVLAVRRQLDLLERAFSESQASDQALLGTDYHGLETAWAPLKQSLTWSQRLRELLQGPVDTRTAEQLLTNDLSPEPVRDALIAWEKKRDAVSEDFLETRQDEIELDLSSAFGEAKQLLHDLHESLSDIDEWSRFTSLRTELAEAGLQAAVDYCAEHRVVAEDFAEVIERCILERWADEVMRVDKKRFEPLTADDHDRYIEEFRALDRALIDQARSRVMEACNAIRPRSKVGAAGILEREANKKRRHMPIRLLLEKTAPVSQALKPCFMMSPLTVSQFLPPTIRFDAVIFDEASQVRPSDAVNCIYRGNQLIVAGDQKQLPPTSFFERVALDEDDEYEEEQFEEFESILDLCKGSSAFRSIPLRWHYRSQYEDLITYSNYSFYQGRLITFPGAVHEAADLGAELIPVDGVYRRGGPRDNPLEAAKVAERVLYHIRAHPHWTLGVVAFSEAQAGAIEVEVEKQRRTFPELDSYFSEDRLRGFFVKNLESVQGDERDIIIFSVGYGPDEAGKFTLQFGPLNKKGGHRRLNVAITRARRRVEVIASITAADFHGDSASEGVRHLKRYLDFLERGQAALALELSESDRDVESPFEAEVAQVIRSWGYEVVPQVGAADYRIDLALRDPARPGRFALGIECDGAMYHSSKVARDRDRLRQEVLEGLDWKLYRIWGTAWYRDRAGQEVRLRSAIEAAISEVGPDSVSQREIRAQPRETEFELTPLDHPPSWTEPYRIASPRAPRWYVEMHDPSARLDLKRMIKEVALIESPIAEELALRRVREAWGTGRAGSRIRGAFNDAMNSLIRQGEVKRDRFGFLWIGELKGVRVPVEETAETRRTIEEVPAEELQLAVQHLVFDARSIAWDELTTSVARLFGWSRRGLDIAVTLDDAVEALVDTDVIRLNGDSLEPGI